jgi:phage-related minor tail protein
MTEPIEFRLRYVLESGPFDRAIQQSAALTRSFEGTVSGLVDRISTLGGLSQRFGQSQAQAATSSQAFLAALERQVATLNAHSAAVGKTEGDLLRIKAAELGVAATAEGTISALERQAVALNRQVGTQRLLETVRALNEERAATEAGIAVDIRAGQAKRDLIAQIEAETAALLRQAEAPASAARNSTVGAFERRVAQAAAGDAAFAAQGGAAIENLRGAQQAAQGAEFVRALERTSQAAGRTRAELLQLQAAELGVAEKAAPFIARIAEVDRGFQSFSKTGRLTALEFQQVGYQLNDFFVQVASGQNVLTAFIQQGSQLSGTFGGFGAAVRALASLISPAVVAVGAIVAAVGSLGYAFIQGAKDAKAFSDALVLSGNRAGQTADSYNALAKALSDNGQLNVTDAREAIKELIKTGEIGQQNMAAAAEATARYSKATGKSAADVAKDFADMRRDVARWATEHNRSLNFLTAAQLEHIRRLQETGQEVEASAFVYDKLNERLRNLEPNLGTLDRAIRTATNAWKAFWDAAYDVGRPETLEDQLQAALKALEDAEARRQRLSVGVLPNQQLGLFERRQADQDAEEARTRVREIRRLQERQREKTDREAADKELSVLATKADEFARGILRGANNQREINRLLQEAEVHFRNNAEAVKRGLAEPITAATQEFIRRQIRNRSPDTEARQQSAAAINEARRIADTEKAIVQQQQEQLKAEYDVGLITLTEYYDKRVALVDRATKAESTRIQTVIEALEVEKAADISDNNKAIAQSKIAEEKERSQKNLADAAAQLAKVEREGSRDQIRLNEQLIQQDAEIAQLHGREAEAERLRNRIRVERFALDNRRAGESPQRVVDYSRLLEQVTLARDLQTQLGQASERASIQEEEFTLAAEKHAASLSETERGIYEVRVQSLNQLDLLVTKLEDVAAATDDPRLQLLAERWRLQLRKAAEEVDPFLVRMRSLADSAGDAIAQGFADAAIQGDNLIDTIRALDRQLAQLVLNELAVKPLGKSITNLIRGEDDRNLKAVAGLGGGGATANIGDQLAGILAKIIGTPNTPQETFRQSEITYQNATQAVDAMAQAATGSADVLGQIPQLAAIPATTSLIELGGAAQIASNALLRLAGSTAGEQASPTGGLFSAILGFFGIGGGSNALPANLIQVGQETPGFADGGFTGNIPPTEPAGIVHGGEFVFSAAATQRLGVPLLETMHKAARGYAEGGYVEPQGGARMADSMPVQPRRMIESQSAGARDQRTVVVNVRAMPGQTRDTVNQQGYMIGRAAQIAARRNG